MKAYRQDIDGLRAVAIIPVVLFHAGVSSFGGGYVGVDVFFVISGFLITSIIAKEIREDRFSFLSFYERRARRIFPALFFMLLVCTAFTGMFYLSTDFQDFGKSLVATTLFSSNLLFWRQSGYFDGPAEEKPLLHTWSLSVEEQFYIFFPILLLLIRKWGRDWRPILAVLFLASLALSCWGVYHKPTATFYLLPTRAWELLVGSLLAIGAFPARLPQRWREFLAAAGLLLILSSILLYSSKTPFPGLAALPPCIGTGMIILAGTNGNSLVGRALGWRPLVVIGLISYSLYLWHWPLLVFSRYFSDEGPSGVQTFVAVVLATGLAAFSWRYVEKPFRERNLAATRQVLFSASAAAMVCATLAGLLIHVKQGWPTRFPEQVAHLASFSDSFNPRRQECFDRTWIERGEPCRYGAAIPPRWALWGDSHADALVSAVGEVAERHGSSILFYGRSACPPVSGVTFDTDPDDRCLEHNDKTLEAILANPSIESVILISRFSAYLDGRLRTNRLVEPGPDLYPTRPARDLNSLPERREWFYSRMRETITTLQRAGKRVFIMYPVPEAIPQIPQMLAKMERSGEDPATFRVSWASYDRRNHHFFEMMRMVATQDGNLIGIDPRKRLCDTQGCAVFAEGDSLYRDGNHLSMIGAARVAKEFEPYFDIRQSMPQAPAERAALLR